MIAKAKSINKNEIDMTSGNLFKKILVFSVPIIFSSVLQLLYNAADLIVCGQFGSEHSVGAISATNSLINLIIQLFMGLSVGANVLMARCFGAKQQEKAQRVVSTAMIMSVVIGVVLGVFGALCSRYFLRWMNTTDDVIDLSTQYLAIYFCGLPFTLIYNFGSSLMRAVGDTKRPFYFLAVAGVINVGLNLLFVIVFRMDVAGVALATIISQAVSAVCIVVCMAKNKGFFRLSFKQLRFYGKEAGEIVRIGLPAGVQSAIFSLSNVLIQSSINSFGSIAMAGSAASSNIEGFVYTAMNSLYQASTSFTSQNVGARKTERIVPILLSCLGIVTVVGVVLGGTATLFGRQLLGIYTTDPAVIEYGIERMWVACMPYFLCGLMDTACGSIRGLGYSIAPTVVSLAGACGLRIIWIYTIFRAHHSLFVLYLSYPVSWAVTFTAHIVCFIIFFRAWKNRTSKRAIITKAALS